ncbi:hypothetical protein TcG_00098 [Trypanosoma cruzi]|nr:hypothetical protein TcG_00098 [Trypanosoma cruzi]
MRNPRRHPTSHSSQTDGSPAWSHFPNILFLPDSSGGSLLLQWSRRLGPTRIDTTLTRGVEAALARLHTALHGHQADIVKASQSELREGTILKLLRCPALQAPKPKLVSHTGEVRGPRFTKILARFRLGVGGALLQQHLRAAKRGVVSLAAAVGGRRDWR